LPAARQDKSELQDTSCRDESTVVATDQLSPSQVKIAPSPPDCAVPTTTQWVADEQDTPET
jgi:hypothetical protein